MSQSDPVEPRILERAGHPISRQNMSRNAVKVLSRLHRHGHKGYLVGGSVRDLLLGREPKDYDAGTDARPAQIRRIFRNSRIIGRRFRLAHIFFHDGIIEVATFRSSPKPEEQAGGPDELLITSDNAFGTPQEDAFRRDFTINALFYNIADFSVIDYVGGLEDLERQLIRCIGDPDVRFKEDPVRMLRACEFAARLGFGIEDRTQEAILQNRQELDKASSARMTEEVIQLLRCGQAGPAIQWMLDLGLVEVLLPEVREMLESPSSGYGDFRGILPAIDRLMAEDAAASDSGLLAAILLPRVWIQRCRREAEKNRPLSRSMIEDIIRESVAPFLDRFALSNAKAAGVVDALIGFHRMCEPQWTAAAQARFARRRLFADALFLFRAMVEATGEGQDVLDLWRAASREPWPGPEEKPQQRRSRPPRRRRRRRGKGRHSQNSGERV